MTIVFELRLSNRATSCSSLSIEQDVKYLYVPSKVHLSVDATMLVKSVIFLALLPNSSFALIDHAMISASDPSAGYSVSCEFRYATLGKLFTHLVDESDLPFKVL